MQWRDNLYRNGSTYLLVEHMQTRRQKYSSLASKVTTQTRIVALISASLLAWFTLVACASPGGSKRLTNNEKFRTEKDPFFQMMHDEYVKQSKAGKYELVFLGDSITFGWTALGKPIWDREFANLNPGNFGVPGDTSAGVLWRVTHGEVKGLNPKAVVILIGTNDLSEGIHSSTTIENVSTLVSELKKIAPNARIIIVGILPRGTGLQDSYQQEIQFLNDSFARLDNGADIRYLDISSDLLGADRRFSNEMSPDFLHLSENGYEVWAQRLRPLLKNLKPETSNDGN